MRLSSLLADCHISSPFSHDADIHSITQSSKNASFGTLFVCINGFQTDGHRFAQDAYQRGCRCFLAEKPLELGDDAIVVEVESTKRALGLLACSFYGHPSRRLSVIGITGTKGKTTTALLLQKILHDNGVFCGYIGTNGVLLGEQHRSLPNTTPDAITLQRTLAEMADAGCRAVVLEVSSQALMLDRVSGMHFDFSAFTNLYPDHIGPGEHESLAHYLACKKKLFSDFSSKTVFYNADDPHSPEMVENQIERSVSVSMEKDAEYRASGVSFCRDRDALYAEFILSQRGYSADCRLPLIGKENASNALMASAIASKGFGISLAKCAKSMENARISGRSELLSVRDGALAVIDYAHNGESLSQLLSSLRLYAPKRLICLFGSVGERTRMRRKEMSEVSMRLADFSILTSDNPGTEPPESILEDLKKPFLGHEDRCVCICDRKEAIEYAVSMLSPGDILVLAGKGHEQYQLIGKEKLPFSEREILLVADNFYKAENRL